MSASQPTKRLDISVAASAATGAAAPLYRTALRLCEESAIESPVLESGDMRREVDPQQAAAVLQWIRECGALSMQQRDALGPAIWNCAGQLAAATGDAQQAETCLRRAIDQLSSPAELSLVLSNLLQVQLHTRQFVDALDTLERLSKLAGAARPALILEVVGGLAECATFEVDGPLVVVGRKTEGTRLGRNEGPEIQLDNPSVGRRHAEIEWRDDRYYLTELLGRNGSFVNGQRITGPTPLGDGDRLMIGAVELRVSLPSVDECSAAYSEPDPAPSAEEANADEADDPPPYLDENVQFTVYRPRAMRPDAWYPLLAFAHLSERPPDAPDSEPDPVEEVKRQAAQVLGDQREQYGDVTQDSLLAVPREGELTLVPQMPGFRFNPPRRTFLWQESVHREEFRLQAGAELDGQTARGSLTVYLGNIVLAAIPLAIRVDAALTEGPTPPLDSVAARPYRKIFVSYSHADLPIVEEIERYARALGDEYVRDWTHLRAGQEWNNRLMELIAEADVFQLFWSTNSMRSQFVRQEWEYALSLGRDQFIRPTYWEEPLPELPSENLPPEALRRYHFQRMPSSLSHHAPERLPPTPKSPPRMKPPQSSPASPAAKIDLDELQTQIHHKLVDKLDLSRVGATEPEDLRREMRTVIEHLVALEAPLVNRNQREQLVEGVLAKIFDRPREPEEHAATAASEPIAATPAPASDEQLRHQARLTQIAIGLLAAVVVLLCILLLR